MFFEGVLSIANRLHNSFIRNFFVFDEDLFGIIFFVFVLMLFLKTAVNAGFRCQNGFYFLCEYVFYHFRVRIVQHALVSLATFLHGHQLLHEAGT